MRNNNKLLLISFLFFVFIGYNTDFVKYVGLPLRNAIAYIALFATLSLRNISFTDLLKNKVVSLGILVGLIVCSFKFALGQNFVRETFEFIIIPPIIIVVLRDADTSFKNSVLRALILFFVLETSIAILERITQVRYFDTIFTSEMYEYIAMKSELWEFRSTSLLGHPLLNAMCVCVIYAGLLYSNQITFKFKMILFGLLIVSLFSFNSRWATVISIPLMSYEIYKMSLQTRQKLIRFNFYPILFFVVFGSLAFFIVNSDLSGRLLNQELFDSSAMTRIEVLDFIDYLSTSDLLWGSSESYGNLMREMQLFGIENGFITFLLYLGIIGTSFTLGYLVYLQFYCARYIVKKKAYIIGIVIFYLIGLSNPNLYSGYVWQMFFLVSLICL